MLTSIVGVVILLGGLIFFHELGHYAVAKFFGVRVETFSLGFGKKLLRWQYGETEYCLSLIPLGGYVKLMGDDPYKGVPAADSARAFSTQALYKRFLIVAAGPIFNLILAYALFTVIYWLGNPVTGTRLGTVVVSSPSWNAGLRAGDKIVSIDDFKLESWSQIEEGLRDKVGQTVKFGVDRNATSLSIPYTVTLTPGRNRYGEPTVAGGLKGSSPFPLAASIGVSDPHSIAYLAGLRTGDLVTKVDTQTVSTFDDLRNALAVPWKEGRPATVTVERGGVPGQPSEKSFVLTFPSKMDSEVVRDSFNSLEGLGVYSSDVFVKEVSPGSAAERGGMLPGDRVAKVADQVIYNFETIVEIVQETGAKAGSVKFTLEREGKPVVLDLVPKETMHEDPLTHAPVKRYLVGFAPRTVLRDGERVEIRVREPVALVTRAVVETNRMAEHMVVSLVKLASGSISVKNLGGPVLIASVAGKSLEEGLTKFLQTMALISINLFLLNLFPIPVLDGGHLLFFCVEAVKGKPVSLRTMEVANQVGMVLILMLVALTFFNDISRVVSN